VPHEISQHLAVTGAHHRAFWYDDHEVVTTRSVTLVPGTMLARRGAAVWMIAEREERRRVAIGDEVHVAPGPAIATVGTTLRHVRLTTERHRTRATIAAAQIDVDLIDE